MRSVRERLPHALDSLVVQVPLVLLLHAILWRCFFRFCVLRPEAYLEPILVAGLWRHPQMAIFLALDAGLIAAFHRRLEWKALEAGGRTRWFVFAVAAIMAWAFSTYNLNLYLGQAHLYDRLLLLALLGLILVHPVFVVLFTGVLLIIALQLQYPLPGAIGFWPDKRLLIDCLILFNAFLLSRLVTRQRRDAFLFVALCLTGANYANAAVLKMQLGPHAWAWLLDNRISNLIVSSYTNAGWLRPLGEERVARLAASAAPFDLVMTAGTLLIELSGLAILLTPRLTRWVIAGFILLHVAILMSSGVFFWKWILLDLALWWYHRRSELDARREAGVGAARAIGEGDAVTVGRRPWALYRRSNIVLALLVMAGSRLYFYHFDFAWFDTKLSNYFVLYGVGESGERYRIEPRLFAPYEMLFVQSRFYYLLPSAALVSTFGTSRDHEVARALEGGSVADLPELRARHGRAATHRPAAAVFAAFTRRYLERAQERQGRRLWINWLAPPFHFQSMAAEDGYRYQERLVRVEVEFEERLFDGERILLAGRQPVLSFPLGVREGEGNSGVRMSTTP